MLLYEEHLKELSRDLRKDMTEAEKLLWSKLRRKQVLGVQFYRQKPIDKFIVDFYAGKIRLVIEVDGSHHYDLEQKSIDAERTAILESLGCKVIRFSNREVLVETDSVLTSIYEVVQGLISEQ